MANQLDKTYHFILKTFVERGYAPHYTEIAKEFQVSPEEGRTFLHELMSLNAPMWLYPETDLIASFAPFNNLPTQYHLSIEGHQKWFAQGGLEALAVCWVFPDRMVSISAPCIDCGEQMEIEIRNGIIERCNVETIHGYVDIPFARWAENWPYTGSKIHLFRSKEHIEAWSGFRPGTEEAMLPLDKMLSIVSTPKHKDRLCGHYISSSAGYGRAFLENLKKVTGNSSFWQTK